MVSSVFHPTAFFLPLLFLLFLIYLLSLEAFIMEIEARHIAPLSYKN